MTKRPSTATAVRTPRHLCPVCGYDRLPEPAADHTICPSCGTQFDYHDATTTHEELRRRWLAAGAPWHSKRLKPPRDWRPQEQLTRVTPKTPVTRLLDMLAGWMDFVSREERRIPDSLVSFDELHVLYQSAAAELMGVEDLEEQERRVRAFVEERVEPLLLRK